MISIGLTAAGIAGVAASAMLGMLLAEIPAISRWLAPKVVRRATRRLPKRLRAQKEEEWLAELQAMEGIRLFRAIFAFGCFGAAIRIRRAEPARRRAMRSTRLTGGAGRSRWSGLRLNGNVSREEFWNSLAAVAGLVGSSSRDIFEAPESGERRWFVSVPRAEIGISKRHAKPSPGPRRGLANRGGECEDR